MLGRLDPTHTRRPVPPATSGRDLRDLWSLGRRCRAVQANALAVTRPRLPSSLARGVALEPLLPAFTPSLRRFRGFEQEGAESPSNGRRARPAVFPSLLPEN